MTADERRALRERLGPRTLGEGIYTISLSRLRDLLEAIDDAEKERDAANSMLKRLGDSLLREASELAQTRDDVKGLLVVRDLALDVQCAKVALLRDALMRWDYSEGERPPFCAGCDLDGAPDGPDAHHDDDCVQARAALAATAPL